MKTRITYTKNSLFRSDTLSDNWNPDKGMYDNYTEMILIMNNNWYTSYIDFPKDSKYNKNDLFVRFCIYNNLLGNITKKLQKMPIIKSNNLNLIENSFKSILGENNEIFLYGYHSTNLYKDDDIKLKLIMKMIKKGFIRVFKDLEYNNLLVISTDLLFETLDKGFDGFRTVFVKRPDSKYLVKLAGICDNRTEEYKPCIIKDNKLVVTNKSFQ